MPYLSPPTLTRAEQETLLHVSASHPRDHMIFSLALGTGLRLSEIVGLDVREVLDADGEVSPETPSYLTTALTQRRPASP